MVPDRAVYLDTITTKDEAHVKAAEILESSDFNTRSIFKNNKSTTDRENYEERRHEKDSKHEIEDEMMRSGGKSTSAEYTPESIGVDLAGISANAIQARRLMLGILGRSQSSTA